MKLVRRAGSSSWHI